MRLSTVAAAVAFMVLPHIASAQDAGSRYAASYKMTGFMLRASFVCPGNKKAMIDRALKPISTSEYITFSQAYPQTIKQWMTEGAELFNDAVMHMGINTVCAKAG